MATQPTTAYTHLIVSYIML